MIEGFLATLIVVVLAIYADVTLRRATWKRR